MNTKLSKAETARIMKEERQRLNDTIDEHALDIIRDKDEYISFLNLYSRLNFSIRNSLLIHAADPDATAINSFAGWKKAGIRVKNKEKSFRIFVPNGTYTRKDGTEAPSFTIKTVVDISATDAKPDKPQLYDPREVRDSLIFGDEESYEGMSLSDAIDYACKQAGEPNDEFTIAAAAYALKHRYGVTPNSFDGDVVSYFSDTTVPEGAKSQLREVHTIYQAIREKIDLGLYLRKKEKTNEQQR
jgi:hypothetical protein